MRRIKSHTLEKLKYFEKYIEAYLFATKRLSKKYYIDAFAGTGKCIFCEEDYCNSKGGSRCEKCGSGNYIDGSGLIALKAKNRFSGYLLIEENKSNFISLKKSIEREMPYDFFKGIILKNDDCNKVLLNLNKHIDFDKYTGFFVFLDPESSELSWDTIKCLSKIEKIDLMILYPYNMSLVRLIRDYSRRLDNFYGTNEWEKIYKNRISPNDAKIKLLNFYRDNLKKLDFKYVEYRQIKRSLRSGKPLYHLMLATRNDTAKKIMIDIFDKELDGQQKIKLPEN